MDNRFIIKARNYVSGSSLGMVYAYNMRIKTLGSREEAEKEIE